jgi:hypothetical protein
MVDRTVKIEGGTELKDSNGYNLKLQPSKGNAIVIADMVIYPRGILFVGTTGDIAVIPADNPDAKSTNPTGWVVYKNIPDGTFFEVPIVRVGNVAAGTTATDLVINF